jgi:hypothetical protein
MNEITRIPFHGDEILAVEQNGKKYVAMKPIVEAMGLDWKNQYNLIKRDTVLSEGMVVTTIPSNGGLQETVCLPLEYLNGWLFKVPASRYSGKKREAIELYQRECYHALYDYWHNGGAVNPQLDEGQAAQVIGKIAESGRDLFSGEVIDLLKMLCAQLEENSRSIMIAAQRVVYLENFEPAGRPFEISEITGREKNRFVRGYWSSNFKAKTIKQLNTQPELPFFGGANG